MDDRYKQPSHETSVRVQGDRDTARGDGSSDRVSPPWKIGDRLNDFVLEEFLGKGTSGFVYRVLDRVTGRRCALKLLLPSTPEDLVRNKLGFRRMMSIQHPSLLRVDRIHQLGSYIALSMEEVDGVTLPEAVKKLRQIDIDSAYHRLLQLTRQYAAGLAAMHVNGFVHRDVKPQNLMVDRSGNGRVIDYGLVGTFDPETDPNGYRHYLAGTPRYFAPEMLWNQFYLPAGDIFGLGMVMLEALRGVSRGGDCERPGIERSDTSPRDDAERITEAIEGLDKSVPDALRDICLKMLRRDPGERPTAMRVARLGTSEAVNVVWPNATRLIGREQEAAEIRAWLDGIYAGDAGRLHLTGPSGIGKTRLIDDIEKYVRSLRRGQVFRARCRLREDQPLQAFDQLCDAIANRYKRGDREPLELDPISATILHTVFPALKNIVRCSMQLAPAGATTERLDALEAAARMSDQLRKVGPLILIIDDAQWADRDSLNVLDRLQTAVGEIGLGIITVSRDTVDSQRVPASHQLALQPLEACDSVAILADAAKRHGVQATESTLQILAQVAGGSPFRLHELVEEFQPGGALSQICESTAPATTLAQLGRADWIWRKRAKRLSEDAHRVLSFIVTAGRRVSTQQLGELTGLGDAVDAVISELVQQRLVIDDATGGECIQIVHDRVAEGFSKTLDQEVTRKAHHAWATLLIHQEQSEKQAARIAGHFFAADEPGRAVSHAILAAEDAERLVAKTEAARWHALVVDHVDGPEKVNRLRHAARCFYEADRPIEAAEYYQRLGQYVDLDERIECQLLAASLSIRGGRFSEVRSQLQDLTQTLGLPRPKPPLLSVLVRTALAIRQSLRSLTSNSQPFSDGQINDEQPIVKRTSASLRDKQRLKLCHWLARPMSMFDNLYSAELYMTGSLLASKYGTEVERVHTIVGQSVYGCYDKGAKRTASEATLRNMQAHVEKLQNSRASADWWAGTAFSHALSCRWIQVIEAAQKSVSHYEHASDASGFEIAHTRWTEIWACWNLGRWDSMMQISDAMFEDAIRRNDLFQRMIVTSGIGCSAWLARDRTSELDRIRDEDDKLLADSSMQMFHLFGWFTSVQRMIYGGEFDKAWRYWKAMAPVLNKLPYSRLQLIRLVGRSLGVLVSLHMLGGRDSTIWVRRIGKLVRRMRREQLPYACMLANLYDGLLRMRLEADRMSPGSQNARRLLLAASSEAKQLGLRPFQLAADDALSQFDEGRSLGLLCGEMRHQGIECPRLFERLYTLPPLTSSDD